MDYTSYTALQPNEPIKTYKKTILAGLQVVVWNARTNQEEVIILQGEQENSIVDIYNESELKFFRQRNRKAIQEGSLAEFNKPKTFDDMRMEINADVTDSQLEDLLDSKKTKYFALRKWVNQTNVVAPLARLLKVAEEKEVSTKLLELIQERISEIQLGDL